MAKQNNLNRGKPKNFMKTVKRLVKYMSGNAWLMLLVFILAVLSALFQTQLPRVMGNITTLIFEGVSSGVGAGTEASPFQLDFQAIGETVLLLAGLYAGNALARYFQQFITARVAQQTVYNLRKDLKEKMGRMPIGYFDSHSTGDILSRAINDMDQVSNALGQTLTQSMNSLVLFFALLFTMFSMSGPLAIIVILMVPINAVLMTFVIKRSQKEFARRSREQGNLNDLVEEVYSGHSIVKVYNNESLEQEEFEKRSDELNDASTKAEWFSGLMNPLVGFSKDIIYGIIAVVGGFGVMNGSIQIGVVQSFLQYTNQFSQPFRLLAVLSNTIQITIASTERVFEVLDEDEMEEVQGARTIEDSPYKVSFDHVQFGYDDNDLLMTDFNLDVEEGEMVAVVGPTGAGKTTLINLLERFYDVKGGSIRYDGVDIRNISKEELRENFAMVLQQTWLFNGTIWDNLKYGNEEATDEEILSAAKAAHVNDFVERLPQGYDTEISGEGGNLSQGQQQLITIARAFLQDPDVLILDEATSSVDTRTEVLIQRAMRTLLEGRTSFVVAHRLSTIRDADNIIVMDSGDVVEQGNHNELMDRGGFYAHLYNAQFA